MWLTPPLLLPPTPDYTSLTSHNVLFLLERSMDLCGWKPRQLTGVFRLDVGERDRGFAVEKVVQQDPECWSQARPGSWLRVDKWCVKMPLFLAVCYMRLCIRMFPAFGRHQLECFSTGRSMCKNIVVAFLLDFFSLRFSILAFHGFVSAVWRMNRLEDRLPFFSVSLSMRVCVHLFQFVQVFAAKYNSFIFF